MVTTALTLALLVARPSAPEGVPSSLLHAIAQVESRLTPEQSRRYQRVPDGRYGEVSMWQLTPDACAYLGVSVSKVRRNPGFAEDCAARYLLHLYSKTKSWKSTLAAYHRGLGGRRKAEARDYAQRCLNLAEFYP